MAKKRFSRSSLAAPMLGVLVFALVLLLLNARFFWAQFAYRLQPQKEVAMQQVTPRDTAEKEVRVAPEPKVIIPKIGIDAPVVYGMTSIAEPDIQRSLQDGVLHFADSPKPGQAGNGIYVGHSSNVPWAPGNYKFVFAPLEQLEVNDTFYLNHNSRQYTYKVVSKSVVLPNDVSVLAGSEKPTATLITCTPVGTNLKRLVIRGEQIHPTPAESNSSGPQATVQSLPGN